ncbi:MocR-like pyridoxine biosynthesis transcription factor PdxR [Massilia endophytica]|uniref:MocR-like pyridoxine biosynthesis transcription factor PdxR n=1 Tax=Massilia endophytica TaxID=2899220 RepID=UPI001E54762E|nr:PLP-dependent aminotransferase family protein [Massilia endophytica]UGQ48346.1 PLP-dependent aminotransferase family protein [Massilia endophytica]
MELHLIIEGRRGLAEQVYRQISQAIQSGRLAHGQQLPPSRLLAEQLGISRKPVEEAYRRLGYERLVLGQAGRGSFVNAPAAQAGKPPSPALLAANAALAAWREYDNPLRKVVDEARARYDFIGGSPAAQHFPEDDWRRAVNAALRAERVHRSRYADSAGLPELRRTIASHAAYSRGVAGDPSRVIVTNGAQQALDLLARVLLEPGACVAVEDPCYPAARQLFRSHRARVAPVPVDAEGIVVERIPEDARLVYVTPAHQFPLGMAMSEARKRQLLDHAARSGAVIIEDDYDSEFRYEGRPADSLQGMDRDGVVVFVGTLSKVLMPELRIGYMVAPEALAEPLAIARNLSDWHGPTLIQHAAARFMEDGSLLRHIRKLGAVYAARREALLAGFAGPLAPWFETVPASAGFHITALARRELDMPQLIRLARRMDVGLYSLEKFYAGAAAQQGLVMGYGAIDTLDIPPALERVRAVLQQMDS